MNKCFIFLLVIYSGIAFGQNKIVDSLLNVLKTIKSDTSKVNILCELAVELDDSKTALDYGIQALELSEKINFTRGKASALFNIAVRYEFLGEPLKSMEFHNKSLEVYKELNDKDNIGEVLGWIGRLYRKNGDLKKAIELSMQALKIAEDQNNKPQIASSTNMLGAMFQDQGDTAMALKYFNKAYTTYSELNDKRGITNVYYFLGKLNLDKRNFPVALDYFQKALQINTEIQYKEGIATHLGNIGQVYLRQQQFDQALDYFHKSLEIYLQINRKEGVAGCMDNIANAYLQQGKTEEAETYYLKCLSMSKDIKISKYILEASEGLSKIYSLKKDYKKAFEMHLLFKEMADSINNIANKKLLVKKEMQYEFNKKEASLKAEQDKKDVIANEKSKQKNYFMIGLSALFIFSILIAWLLLRQNKLKSEQKAMRLEQRLLRLQMNPHFIFNSITAIESFIYEKHPEEAGKYLSDFSRLMRMVLENSREETISLEQEINTLTSFLRLQQLNLEDTFSYSVNVAEELNIEKIKVPPMLLQPFVENAIKHGCADVEHGHVSVSFKQKENSLIIEIADNGKGIQAEKRNKTHKSLATTITKERLSIINSKAKIIYFEIADNYPVGTKVNFNIPIG